MFKKIILFVVIACIFCSTAVFADDSLEQQAVSEPITEQQLEVAEVLSALGIIATPENLQPKKQVTRAEFVMLAMRAVGLDKTSVITGNVPQNEQEYGDLFAKAKAEGEKKEGTAEDATQSGYFSDLHLSHESYQNIISALNMRMISGYGNSEFGPDNPIMLTEAIKVAVHIAGYGALAELRGGYPTGYINIAGQKKLLDNINLSAEMFLTQENCYKLFYNLLHAESLRITTFGNVIHYEANEAHTVMYEHLGIYYDKGIIEATPNASIMDDQMAPNTEIIIDGENYYAGGINGDELLGQKVSFYARYENGDKETKTLLWAKGVKNGKVIKINSEHMNSVKMQGALGAKISYYENDKLENATISDGAKYVYNNTALLFVTEERINVKNGTLTLIDQNGDGLFEVVIIKEYLTYWVDNLFSTSKTIKDKLKKEPFSFLGTDAKFIKDGQEIDFLDIKQWDVVEILKSTTTTGEIKVYAYVLSDTITGNVTEISDEEITIEEKTYSLAPLSDTKKIKVNSYGTFYLDIFGRVIGLKSEVNEEFVYGYLISASVKAGLDETMYFKLADKKDTAAYITLAKNVKVNGTKKDIVDLKTIFSKRQLIRYRTNSENEIIEVMTAVLKDDKNMDLDHFSLDYISNGVAYNNYQNRYGEMYTSSGKTVVFIIPSSDEILDEKYYVKGTNSLVTTNVTSYNNVQIYDANENFEIGALIVESEAGGGGTPIEAYSVYVIKSTSVTIDESGEEKYKIVVYNTLGDEKEVIIDPKLDRDMSWGVDKAIKDLSHGDIINYTVDGFGEANNMAILFDAATVKGTDDTKYICKNSEHKTGDDGAEVFVHSNVYISFQKVLQKTGNSIVLSGKTATGTKKVAFNLAGRKVFMYDSVRNKLIPALIDDVEQGDEVFLHSVYQIPDMLVIYR